MIKILFTIATSEVSALDHEVPDNAVELGSLVALTDGLLLGQLDGQVADGLRGAHSGQVQHDALPHTKELQHCLQVGLRVGFRGRPVDVGA